ncbi:hypothetical protein DB44_HF00010, partial [Candidatus Protochlamydia amoebophila]
MGCGYKKAPLGLWASHSSQLFFFGDIGINRLEWNAQKQVVLESDA